MATVAARSGRTRGKDGPSRGSTLVYVTTGAVLSVLFLAASRLGRAPVVPAAGADHWRLPAPGTSRHLTIANYSGLITGSIHILRYVWNSLLVAGGTAVLTAGARHAGRLRPRADPLPVPRGERGVRAHSRHAHGAVPGQS